LFEEEEGCKIDKRPETPGLRCATIGTFAMMVRKGFRIVGRPSQWS
jgi:hypothetical protein